ncbi:alpha/beta fold hydrolase [Streptomyces sp. NPDC089919]|uniref:alpha/beta fold hydrolase n=1 Tax=Streptomyces sp. NPDC089919 TaxID=3155188 RepID=UPI00342FD24E
MNEFILVPGVFTDGHVWEATADRLRGAGAGAHAVTFGGDRADLETDIADVLRVIDGVDAAAEIVLVGHDYGIHPVIGAADRRAGRIARIVYVDAGMPQDGVPALAAVPDQELRERLAAAEPADGALAAPASEEEWRRWGSTAGVPADALELLTRRAVPQPLGTLRRPLRLTGAVYGVPTSGVLCSGNGAGIEMLQHLVNMGLPEVQGLAAPQVTFFELATGHWPMLSTPVELAGALLAAAAGEGHRLTPAADELPVHLRPFLLETPEVPVERTGHVDLYVPRDADGPRPAVVFVHGGPVPAGSSPRDWPMFCGYARLAAQAGAVGVTLDHRLHDLTGYPDAAEDVAAAVALVRADPRVDPDRIALWFFSGGGPLAAGYLAAPPAWLRTVAATYPILAPLPNWGLTDPRFLPVAALAGAGDLPVVLTRAGLEMAEIDATVEQFLAAAEEHGTRLEVVDVPAGDHGFETLDPTDASRDAVHRALAAVLAHLGHVRRIGVGHALAP